MVLQLWLPCPSFWAVCEMLTLLISRFLCFALHFFLCYSNSAIGEMCPGKGVRVGINLSHIITWIALSSISLSPVFVDLERLGLYLNCLIPYS